MNKKEFQSYILDHREFNIKSEKNEYNLRIEISQDNLRFILSVLNSPMENIYKNKLNLISLVNKLELNSTKYSNLDLILKIFDSMYEKNKIYINIIDDNSCILILKVVNMFEEEVVKEIKLYKIYMNNEDKFNVLYNKLKLLNIGNINFNNTEEKKQSELMKNKLNELNKNLNKREEEMKLELNKKDIIINEIKEKLNNIENELKVLNDLNINVKKIEEVEKKINTEKNMEELLNKKIEQIEKKIIIDINNKLKNTNNNIINDKDKQNTFIQNINENNKDDKILKNLEGKYNDLIENIELIKKLEKEVEKLKKEKIIKKEESNRNSPNKIINNYVEKNSHKEIESFKEEIKKINNKIKSIDKELKKLENIINEKETLMNKIMAKQNTISITNFVCASINNNNL